MAGDYGREPEDFSIINVMLPRRYHPDWQGNVFERRAASVAEQLCGDGHGHRLRPAAGQAAATRTTPCSPGTRTWPTGPTHPTPAPPPSGWPSTTRPSRTAACASSRPPTTSRRLRPHVAAVRRPGRVPCARHRAARRRRRRTVPRSRRGDVTVHNERVMHGSGGNTTDGFRRAYILAFRSATTSTIERELGFTHSHNDDDDGARRGRRRR